MVNMNNLVYDGISVIVPFGTKHRIYNNSKTKNLKIYTLYGKPGHKFDDNSC